jgi:hypothetical protein
VKARPHREFRHGELALALLVVVALGAFLFARFDQYRFQAEKVAVRHMLATLDTALQVASARTGGQGMPIGANPMDLLDAKPLTYLGEVNRFDDKEIPPGNWVFDLRDKTLVYKTFSEQNFTFSGSMLLRFKVESNRLYEISGTPARNSGNTGLALNQVDGTQP